VRSGWWVFRGNIERQRVESAEFRADQAVPMSEQLVPPTEQGHALVRSAIIGAFRIWLIKTSASLMAFKASSIQKHDSQHSPLSASRNGASCKADRVARDRDGVSQPWAGRLLVFAGPLSRVAAFATSLPPCCHHGDYLHCKCRWRCVATW
jgi:hypothetical protein